jgi:hypothetical protein
VDIFGKNYKVSATVIILIALIIIMGVSLLILLVTGNFEISSIFGSLVAGLIVAIIQFIIALQDYMQTEKLKKLMLIKIIYDKYEKAYYKECMDKAEHKIYVMGTTAARFLEDFADNVLLDKLQDGILVKMLLVDKAHLEEDKKNDFEKAKRYIDGIKEQFSNDKFDVRYFKHGVCHSIFVVDDTCIIGPIFSNMQNKDIPALHVNNTSPFALKYLKYFDYEWGKAQ